MSRISSVTAPPTHTAGLGDILILFTSICAGATLELVGSLAGLMLHDGTLDYQSDGESLQENLVSKESNFRCVKLVCGILT